MFNIKHFYSVSFNIVLLSTVHATLIILYVLFGYFPSYILYIVIISLCLFVFLTWAFHSRAIALYSMCIYTYIIHTCTYINIHTHIYICIYQVPREFTSSRQGVMLVSLFVLSVRSKL